MEVKELGNLEKERKVKNEKICKIEEQARRRKQKSEIRQGRTDSLLLGSANKVYRFKSQPLAATTVLQ